MTFAAKIEVRLPKWTPNHSKLCSTAPPRYAELNPNIGISSGAITLRPLEGKQAILRAMGWAAGSADELEKSLADHARREWRRLAPATIVAMEADDVDLPLHLPAENLGDAVSVTLRREDGATEAFSFQAGELPQTGSIDMDGRTWVQSTRPPPHPFASGIPRDRREMQRGGGHYTLHRGACAGIHPPGTRARRTRGRRYDCALRIALNAQLGLRRLPRSVERHRLGGGRPARQLCRPESAARHPQPAPL